jgi:hypothetical protein
VDKPRARSPRCWVGPTRRSVSSVATRGWHSTTATRSPSSSNRQDRFSTSGRRPVPRHHASRCQNRVRCGRRLNRAPYPSLTLPPDALMLAPSELTGSSDLDLLTGETFRRCRSCAALRPLRGFQALKGTRMSTRDVACVGPSLPESATTPTPRNAQPSPPRPAQPSQTPSGRGVNLPICMRGSGQGRERALDHGRQPTLTRRDGQICCHHGVSDGELRRGVHRLHDRCTHVRSDCLNSSAPDIPRERRALDLLERHALPTLVRQRIFQIAIAGSYGCCRRCQLPLKSGRFARVRASVEPG